MMILYILKFSAKLARMFKKPKLKSTDILWQLMCFCNFVLFIMAVKIVELKIGLGKYLQLNWIQWPTRRKLQKIQQQLTKAIIHCSYEFHQNLLLDNHVKFMKESHQNTTPHSLENSIKCLDTSWIWQKNLWDSYLAWE